MPEYDKPLIDWEKFENSSDQEKNPMTRFSIEDAFK